jgi:hypothetical protein
LLIRIFLCSTIGGLGSDMAILCALLNLVKVVSHYQCIQAILKVHYMLR